MSLKSLAEKMPGYNSLVLPWHWLEAVKAGVKYRWPAKNLRVIGVTGTNGKTTTCFMIWKMLNEAGHKTGLLTTVGWSEDGKKLHDQVAHMTTERVDILNERMRKVADAGAEFLVLEVTSHALAQYRTLGVPIEIAVFTNLTHEHLDYHKTMKKYRNAKLKLFKKSEYGVVNADDPSAIFFMKPYAYGDIISYGIEQGDLRATEVELKASGVKYVCHDMRRKGQNSSHDIIIETQIPGKFNVYNSLATVAVGKRVGLSDQEIASGIRALESVEGRMTRVREGQNFEVIVDYAHTPDALEKVFQSVASGRISSSEPASVSLQDAKSSSVRSSVLSRTSSENPALCDGEAENEMGRKIISVHGGAGQRDSSTRAERGEILGKNSDIVIITEDDSRDEDPQEIAEMFVKGAEKAGKVRDKDLFVIIDRREAIKKAIKMAKEGDVVLILGKGHEKTILRGDGAHEFEDEKVAREILLS